MSQIFPDNFIKILVHFHDSIFLKISLKFLFIFMKVLITIVSSNINEITRAILNSFIEKLHNNNKKAQNANKRIKIKNAPKKHLRRK